MKRIGRLYLLRHGVPRSHVLQAEDLVIAEDDDGLTEQGAAGVRAVAVHLAAEARGARIIASPMRRARETAALVADAVGSPVEYDDRLRERDLHVGPQTTVRQSQQWQLDATQQPRESVVGSESIEQHGQRVRAWLEDSLPFVNDDRTLIAVCHGGTIEQILRVIWRAPLESVSSMFVRCDPAHYHLWHRVRPRPGMRVWRLDAINQGAPRS